MELNDCGCFIGGYETFEVFEKKRFGFIRINLGEEDGKWGYALGFMGAIGGHLYPLTPDRLVYDSRSEAVKAAVREVNTIHCENTGTFSTLVQEMVEKLTADQQLGLF